MPPAYQETKYYDYVLLKRYTRAVREPDILAIQNAVK
jgi:hypothetical protein